MADAPTTYDLLRDAIVERVRAVPDVGQVHERPRHAVTADGFVRLYRGKAGEPPLLGWELHRTAVEAEVIDDGAQQDDEHAFRLVGFASHRDAADSYTAWQRLVDRVRAALSFMADLGAGAAYRVNAPAAREVGAERFGRVLVHSAMIDVMASRRELDADVGAAPDVAEGSVAARCFDALDAALGALEAPRPAILRNVRNAPLERPALLAYYWLERVEPVRDPAGAVLDRYVVPVVFSADVLDSPGAGGAATGADQRRLTGAWLRGLAIALHDATAKTSAIFLAIPGLHIVTVDDEEQDRDAAANRRDRLIRRNRIEAGVVVSFDAWRGC